MTTAAFSLFRSLLIYGICVPLALILGYLISTPDDFTSYTVVGLVLFCLLIPALLRWHHIWLIATWNMSVVLFFIPGRPRAWMIVAWISLTIAFIQFILNRKNKFLNVPELIRPLVLLTLVVLVTAKFTGGFGARAFGGDTFGAKRYFMMISAIAGYFAITSQRIPPDRVPLYVALYFLGALTLAVGELAAVVSPALYFIFLIFPVGGAGLTAVAGEPLLRPGMQALSTRLSSLAGSASAVYMFMLCRFGIQRLLAWRHLGRLTLFITFLLIGMYGGFRSMLILFLLTFLILFYLEGLFRTPMLPALVLVGLVIGAVLVPFSDRLPLQMQRSLSFLPINVDPIVKAGAQGSTEWRVQMWKHLLPEVPEYLFLGKGLSFASQELDKTRILNPMQASSEGSELVGDYHNGPLSVIIPFGVPGVIAFLWLLFASLKVLRQNYLFGDPQFRRVNTFLLAYFIAKTICFFTIFGGLYADLADFVGLVALSVSINGGVAKKAMAPQPVLVFNRFKLQPPEVKPAGA